MNVLPRRPGADAGGRVPDPLDARRSRRDDLGLAQPRSRTTASSSSAPTASSCRDAAEEEIEALLDGRARARRARAHRPRHAHRRRARPLHGIRQDHLPARPAARRAEGGGRLRQRRRLPHRARGAVGTRRRGDPDRGRARTASTSTTTAARPTPRPPPRRCVAHGADLGISLDGDADRVMIIDETGAVADGDQIMALIADRWAAEGRLAERHAGRHGDVEPRARAVTCTAQGLRLLRTAVGDRYVVEAMREGGYNLGGEQSGHIVMTDYVTTGDGLIAGAAVPRGDGRDRAARQRAGPGLHPVPQVLTQRALSRRARSRSTAASVRAAITAGEARLNGPRPAGDPQVGHRAADPDHGRMRGRGPSGRCRQRHRRRGRGGCLKGGGLRGGRPKGGEISAARGPGRCRPPRRAGPPDVATGAPDRRA